MGTPDGRLVWILPPAGRPNHLGGMNAMTGWVVKSNLVGRISEWTVRNASTVKEIVGAFLEAIYQAIKRGNSVSLAASAHSTCGRTGTDESFGSTCRSAYVLCLASPLPTAASCGLTARIAIADHRKYSTHFEYP